MIVPHIRGAARAAARVVLSLPEAAQVLFALDLGFECLAEGSPDRAQVANARLLLTRRLWPELGDLLGPADDPEG
ncbi:MAG TPA: hypothetical protein VMV09_01640 [Candidatus Saccharimonadales bacterium]|nr:hypothetical protein [Candidatus Saccharimonadales bacterium]